MSCTGCGVDGPTRLTPHGRWCPSCMPPQPVPDPALTLDGLRTAAGISLDTYPWCPALRRKPQPEDQVVAPPNMATLGPAAQRVVERGERITRDQWRRQQQRVADAPPDRRAGE